VIHLPNKKTEKLFVNQVTSGLDYSRDVNAGGGG